MVWVPDNTPPKAALTPIRTWARDNGWPNIATRGALPTAVVTAYTTAHPGATT